jgi:hypothetical protein
MDEPEGPEDEHEPPKGTLVGTNYSSVLKSLAFFSLPVHAGAP